MDRDLAGLRIKNEALQSEVQRDKQSLWKATAQLDINGEQLRKEASSLQKKLEEQTSKVSALQQEVTRLRHDAVELRKCDTKLREDNARLAAEYTGLFEQTVLLREALHRSESDAKGTQSNL